MSDSPFGRVVFNSFKQEPYQDNMIHANENEEYVSPIIKRIQYIEAKVDLNKQCCIEREIHYRDKINLMQQRIDYCMESIKELKQIVEELALDRI
jgi:RNA binding exosome subunit